jgi:Flp pilus assembly protein TadG
MFISRFSPKWSTKGFGSDISGTAGIEFALIAPIALMMLLGAIEYSRAVVMARRFNLVTATISDLVARDDYEDANTMLGLQNAVTTIWSPYKMATLDMKVIAVRQAALNATKRAPQSNYVYWAQPLATATAAPAQCSDYTGLPAGMLSPGNSTIIVNSTYTYTTLFGIKVPGMTTTTQNWTSSSSHAPRNLCVGWGTANCSTPCE